MSLIVGPNGKPIQKDPIKAMSRRELERFAKGLVESLQNTSARVHMVACELQRVDPKNEIFNMTEGVFDKEHLYIFRKSIKDGSYQKNRDRARLT